jgi:hypothetical protein
MPCWREKTKAPHGVGSKQAHQIPDFLNNPLPVLRGEYVQGDVGDSLVPAGNHDPF